MEIKKSTLATIAYYDGLEFPLTLYEVYRFLINPKRLFPHMSGVGEISIATIGSVLDELEKSKVIENQLGFYVLAGRKELCLQRLEGEKISAQKWKNFLRKARWLQMVPWVDGMFASGSLALGNTTPESDFDVLVITRPGRPYITRLLLSGLTSLMGMRRTRVDTIAPDKFCFNHYITSNRLTIAHESLYNAQTYAHLVPVWLRGSLNEDFFAANLWLNRFLYNFKPHQEMIQRNIRNSVILSGVTRLLETLDFSLGDFLEWMARRYQQHRISNNPMTYAPGGRVVFTDTELEFHPQSFERVVLDRYNNSLQKLNISTVLETDSGLRKS